MLSWIDRVRAWTTSKEVLQSEIGGLKQRLFNLMAAKDEVLSNALLFENEDVTRWLNEIASTDKGALAIKIRDLQERNDELQRRHSPLVASERKAWETCDAVIEAWEHASGVKTATWDRKKKEWVPDIRSPVLPQEVVDMLVAWINRDNPSRKAKT